MGVPDRVHKLGPFSSAMRQVGAPETMTRLARAQVMSGTG